MARQRNFIVSPDGYIDNPNVQLPSIYTAPTATTATAGTKLKGVFNNLRSKVPPLSISSMWNKQSGIQPLGIGKGANIGSGIAQGIQGIQNLSNLGRTQADYKDLQGDILNAYYSNPLANSFLSPEQSKMIRQIKRGTLNEDTTPSEGFWNGIVGNLGDTLTSAGLGFVTGGIPGAIIGGAGGLINSGISGATQATQSNMNNLDALYQQLLDAQAQYNAMKRPNMTGMGIQQRYQQMYQ